MTLMKYVRPRDYTYQRRCVSTGAWAGSAHTDGDSSGYSEAGDFLPRTVTGFLKGEPRRVGFGEGRWGREGKGNKPRHCEPLQQP